MVLSTSESIVVAGEEIIKHLNHFSVSEAYYIRVSAARLFETVSNGRVQNFKLLSFRISLILIHGI